MVRFLHLHTFYPEAINQVYRKFPGLSSTQFSFQSQAILDDAFSSSHIFTPYLEKMGYETLFVVANNPHAQSQWMRENNALLSDKTNWVKEIAAKQIEVFRPDVVYSCNPVLFDSPFIQSLTHKPALVMGWRGADIDDSINWSAYDVILSGLPLLLETAKKLGARNTEFFFPGFPTHIAEEVSSVPARYDVVFTGSWTHQQHVTRNEYLTHIAQHATDQENNYSCALHLAGDLSTIPPAVKPFVHPPVFGKAMHRAMKRGRINVDARANHRYRNSGSAVDIGGEDTVNMRIFEATGTGCFLLTEHFDGLKKYFKPGVEIETFRNREELVEKIRYFLDHPDARKSIAQKGQQRCLQDYNMEKRAEDFDRIIRSYLGGKDRVIPKNINAGISSDSFGTLDDKPAERQVMLAIDAFLQKKQSTVMSSTNDQLDSPQHPEKATLFAKQAENLLRTAVDTFKQGNYADSFRSASKAKALRIPVINVDYLRAACLLHLGKPFDAREALREELHYFPGNANAQQLLDEVMRSTPDIHKINDPEFLEILKAIRPHTMVPEARLYALFKMAKQICVEDLPGSFVECGVARGGSTAMLGIVIKRYSRRLRHHFGFDSFEGMPEPTVHDTQNGVFADDTGWGTGTCAGKIQAVQEICDTLGVGDKVTLVKGYFEDTLHGWKDQIGDIAFLHLDADWYSSTMTILNEFYSQVSPNGYMQFDDYGCWDGCKKAVDEFQQFNNITLDLQTIPGDGQGAWMRK